MALPAIRVGDIQPCPSSEPQPHGAATVVLGNPTVLVEQIPAAHIGSPLVCAGAPTPNSIVLASATVLVGGVGMARAGDLTAHGGVLLPTQATVLVGS